MIDGLLPDCVVGVEAWHDYENVPLFPEERRAIGRAVKRRRREFATARACAREALGRFGVRPLPIAVGEHGQPCWPAGFVGSITHCTGYRACAVAQSERLVAIGIDAEPNRRLPKGVLGQIARPHEILRARESRLAGEVAWDRLLFSAKEATFKAWFPVTGCLLGFEQIVVTLDVCQRAFSALVTDAGGSSFACRLRHFRGRWRIMHGIILVVVVVERWAGPTA